MSPLQPLLDLPPALLGALVALVVLQVGLEVFALVRLFRTPDDELVFGRKLPWVLIILFVNLVGAVVFLMAGKRPATVTDPLGTARTGGEAAGGDSAGERAAEVLYGPRDGE